MSDGALMDDVKVDGAEQDSESPTPRDIHLAGGPAPEGLVGHIARPGGIKNCSPGRQKFKKLPLGYL